MSAGSSLSPTSRGPQRTGAVGLDVLWELLVIVWDTVKLAWYVPTYWFESDAERAALRGALAATPPTLERAPEPPPRSAWPERPLSILISWAEASGEIHARNLIATLRATAAEVGAPAPRFAVLGTRAVAEELGLELVGAPAENPKMGFRGILGALPYYLRLVRDTAQRLREDPPDVFVPVDSPSLHVPLGRLARRAQVRVVHFVTPQLWGWAPWRAARYRTAIDLALSILPFEPAWFARREIPVEHVGHPLVDELANIPETRPPAALPPAGGAGPLLAILPGSRASVVKKNLPWMLARITDLARAEPTLRFAIVQGRPEHAELCRDLVEAAVTPALAERIEIQVGALHATLAEAHAALAVSGTVLLDLLHHRLPAVVVYRVGHAEVFLGRYFLTAPWFASINLLAAREVVPEFAFAGRGPVVEVAAALRRCVRDSRWRAGCLAELDAVALSLGPPGAVLRASRAALRVALEGLADPETPARGPEEPSGA